jgi:hypothetical protein
MKTNYFIRCICICLICFLYLNSVQAQKKSIITIPVVVHVVYKTPSENLSDQRIYEQIAVLNQDFRRLNSDTNQTPIPFKSVAADCEIEFVLANHDPSGAATTGIEHVITTASSFNSVGNGVKHTATGGTNAWDPTQYLNIWVCNLGYSMCGYATFPNNIDNNDGVVVHYAFFGLTGATSPYNKGRTTTQQIGHWFGLHNIGSADCSITDNCSDIPPQSLNPVTTGFPALDTCSPNYPGVMFMNFMSYSDDANMNLFTNCQKDIMTNTLDGNRVSLLTSQGYTRIGQDLSDNNSLQIYPNPAIDYLYINLYNMKQEYAELNLVDLMGRKVQSITKNISQNNDINIAIDIHTLPNGLYNLVITTGNITTTKKIEISH